MKQLWNTIKGRELRVLPLILIMTVVTAVMRPLLAQSYQMGIDAASGTDIRPIILAVALGLGGMAIVNLTNYALNMIQQKAVENTSCRLRGQLFQKLLSLPYRRMQTLTEGKTITLLTEDVDAVSQFLPDILQQVLFGIFQVIFGLAYLLTFSWQFSLSAVGALILGALLSTCFLGKIRRCNLKKMREEELVRSFFYNRIENLAVTKLFSLKAHHVAQYSDKYDKKVKAQIKLTYLQSIFEGIGDFVPMLASASVYVIGFFFIQRGQLTVGQLMGFVNLTPIIYWSFGFLPRIISAYSKQSASAARLAEIMQLESEAEDDPTDLQPDRVAFEQVSFGYQENQEIISNLSYQAKTGDIVGIAGPSGTGKTTLIKLMLGFEPLGKGKIQLCGGVQAVDSKDARSCIAYLPQNSLLINDTILANLKLGNPDATMEQVERAAKRAGIDDFIQSLPDGYETVIAQGGKNVSGGQAQRLCIARTLLKDAPILLFDEPSSALDKETEGIIISAIQALAKDKIIFLVSHTPELHQICNSYIDLGKTAPNAAT